MIVQFVVDQRNDLFVIETAAEPGYSSVTDVMEPEQLVLVAWFLPPYTNENYSR
jgi:hypothetical protein